MNGTANGKTLIGTTTDAGYRLHVAGDIYANGGWLRVSGTSGLYFESYGGGWHMTDSTYVRSYNGKSVHMNSANIDYVGSIYFNSGPATGYLLGNTGGSYGSLQINGAKNGWYGLNFESGNTLMMNSNESGHHQQGVGWKWRWYAGQLYVSRGTYGGGSEYIVLDAGNYNSYAPTLTGGGASGTWGINITGNSNYANSAGSAPTISLTSLGNGSMNVNYGSTYVLRNENGSGAAVNYSPLLHAGAGDTMWQIQGTYGTSGNGTLYFRQGYNGSWGNWLTMLSSANFNSYALPLTGGIVTGDTTFGDGSSSDQGIRISYGNYSSGYGRIRFIQSGTNHSTIHSFSASWQSGTLQSASSGAINLDGQNGVTFGAWNNPSMWVDNSGTAQSRGSMRSPIFYDSENTAYYGDFANSGTSIKTAGNVLIGQTYDPGNKLQVNGNIYAVGDVTAYSDIRVKTNIRSIERVVERIMNIRGVIYDRTDIESNDNIGFIAQELEEQFPELIHTNNDGTKGVKYQNMTAILVEVVKKQQKQIDELKARLN